MGAKRLLFLTISVTFLALTAISESQNPAIGNNHIRVEWQSEEGCFLVESPQGEATGTFSESGGTAKLCSLRDPRWGMAQCIEVEHPSGNIDRILIYRDLPFLLFQSILANTSSTPQTIHSIVPLTIFAKIQGVETENLKANGTFGLIDLETNRERGSYLYAAIADSQQNKGMVAGWLTQEQGSGVVFVQQKEGSAVVKAQLDYGNLRIAPTKEAKTETFVFGFFDDARLGLERYADALAKRYDIQLKPQPTVYCSWYHLWRDVSTEKFISATDAGAKLLKPYGLSVAQIDDGWQSGAFARGTPKKDFLHPNEKFPGGMAPVAQQTRDQGLIPGIWYMPFSGDADDPAFAAVLDLFVKDIKTGKPFDAKWGGNPFDLSNPKALDYVRNMAHVICKDWGYGYLKIDGLWSGLAVAQKYIATEYSPDRIGDAQLSDPSVTQVQAFRDGLRALREGAGDEIYVLGCNLAQNMRTLGGSIGLVDGMRIGPDNGPSYPDILRGPIFGARLYFLHGRVWHNDPDPIYLRNSMDFHTARMLASWAALSGELCSTSEFYDQLPPERLDLLRRTIPAHPFHARPADFFSNPCPSVWTVHRKIAGADRAVIGYFNWGDPNEKVSSEENRDPAQAEFDTTKCPSDIAVISPRSSDFSYDLEGIGLSSQQSWLGYEYWTDQFIAPFSGKLETKVSKRDCRIFSLRIAQPGKAQVLGTSRHITQCLVDIAKESWSNNELSVSQQVVAGDPIEVRIAAGLPDHPLRCVGIELSEADKKAGVTAEIIKQEGWKLRIRIQAPQSRTVVWTARFES
jgi:hypothetical protein